MSHTIYYLKTELQPFIIFINCFLYCLLTTTSKAIYLVSFEQKTYRSIANVMIYGLGIKM